VNEQLIAAIATRFVLAQGTSGDLLKTKTHKKVSKIHIIKGFIKAFQKALLGRIKRNKACGTTDDQAVNARASYAGALISGHFNYK